MTKGADAVQFYERKLIQNKNSESDTKENKFGDEVPKPACSFQFDQYSHYYCNLGYCSSLLRITYTIHPTWGVRT